ncbi:cell division protein FtsK [Longispora sp. NPDC051575]|uniref:cell division protein FtsK n=1 Tax=Longispora sp. NPDC051575 TaxID=3154943 RepID=UPI00343AA73F
MKRRNRQRGRWGRHDPQPLLLVTDDGGSFGEFLSFVGRLGFRYRSELAPIMVTLFAFVVGAWLHAAHRTAWPWIAALSVVLGGVCGLLPRWWAPLRRLAWLDRPAERAYAAIGASSGVGWIAAATAIGPATYPLPLLALVALVLLGVPWWAHHRRRSKVRVERTLEGWPQIADAVGLAGSYVQSAVVDRWGFTMKLGLRKGQTARNVIEAIPAIESGLAARPGAVRVEIDEKRADRVSLRVVDVDPHAQPIPYEHVPAGSASITRPVRIGVTENGDPVDVLFLRRNALIGGMVGSGKSGVLNVVLAWLAASRDVVIWGIDLKNGMELGPWLRCLDRLATTPEQAVALLRDAIGELDNRAGSMATAGERLWHPTKTRPALVIVIDEFAELPDEAAPLADSLARRGRAVAVNMIAATQRPTQKAMGQGAIRSQMDIRIALRVREKRDGDLILSEGMVKAGWHPHTLDGAGKFLVSSPEHNTPKRARAAIFTDNDVATSVRNNANERPTIIVDTDNGKEEYPRFIPSQRPSPENVRDPETVLWAMLAAAPPIGVSVGDLMEITNKGRTWVYDRLNEHVKAGKAERTARGFWRAVDSTGSDDTG